MPFQIIEGEIDAPLQGITPAQRNAIMAARHGLQRLRRGWRAIGMPTPLHDHTIDILTNRDLLTSGPRARRLTTTGKWYARTLLKIEREQESAHAQA